MRAAHVNDEHSSTSHAEREGIIKFDLRFEAGPPPDARLLAPLNGWRSMLHRLGLTARDPARYGGLAFGNLSRRVFGESVADHRALFVISGTQTGGHAQLTQSDYCWVVDFSLRQNRLHAVGPIRPSSEALTHAAVYDAEPTVNCAIHVHSPEIWRQAESLAIPMVDRGIAYGTPDMASALAAIVRRNPSGIAAMGGHEDGVIAFADSIDEAAGILLRTLARALAD